MNSKYKVLKYSSNKFENIEDLISIEEQLEISLKYKTFKVELKKLNGFKNFRNSSPY